MGGFGRSTRSLRGEEPGLGSFGRFLLPDETARHRLLDMHRRLAPVRRVTVGAMVVGTLIAGVWIGWVTAISLAIGWLLFANSEVLARRGARPETVVAFAWMGFQLMFALTALAAGAPEEPALAWMAILVITLAARVSGRGIVLGVAYTLLLMVGVAFAGDAQAVLDDPSLLLVPMVLVLAVAALSTVMTLSDIEHRSEALVDPLTSMLNRKALENRVSELRQQAELVTAPVAIVMIDIDHFKQINDSAGHSVGDDVLRNVSEVIRKDLRAYELAYRLGGEEFLVLLPGASREEGMQVADRLRVSIELATLANGPGVTISCGVAATPGDEGFDFDALLESADRALYAAKRSGRNRSLSSRTAEHPVTSRRRQPEREPAERITA